jgi:hypothetical protein
MLRCTSDCRCTTHTHTHTHTHNTHTHTAPLTTEPACSGAPLYYCFTTAVLLLYFHLPLKMFSSEKQDFIKRCLLRSNRASMRTCTLDILVPKVRYFSTSVSQLYSKAPRNCLFVPKVRYFSTSVRKLYSKAPLNCLFLFKSLRACGCICPYIGTHL